VVLYLEFGVWRGGTTRTVASYLRSPKSSLHGFDSFEGLPESWNIGAKVGHFSTGGTVPETDDPRIHYHKGRFQETLPAFTLPSHEVLVINLDADLYSSTIYVLEHLRYSIVPGTYLYFDEFSDRMHELRAFSEFLDRAPLQFELMAVTRALDKVLFRSI
jgi:hypothetical protein